MSVDKQDITDAKMLRKKAESKIAGEGKIIK